ncbi:putative uncharacterized protein DDB_G0268590 [Leptidea sinapis]|uniref:putative uncharacterized protein DDB_G0268590 n=1 Tax=Leptidea sinapis TaxID=189913 RepID=UPI0021C2ACFE|nr:putative uncharacterized protein DDB_G0268590 [Leptidea sinapis]
MLRVVFLTSTLLAFSAARIYERCELARDLIQLGISKDQLATWVCIAFHESRFDTAARNPYSGDHGLLQISELYWCGAGKACGVPCSAFRDEDISNDVECALRIYEEHTRLQGNGFLAWVVYPQHCKHNAKKYLADCEGSLKDVSPYKVQGRGRSLKDNSQSQNNNDLYFRKFPNIDDLKPPSITINQFLPGFNSGKHSGDKFDFTKFEIKPENDGGKLNKKFQINVGNINKINDNMNPFPWLNSNLLKYDTVKISNEKIKNIDDLKPPVFFKTASRESERINYNIPTSTLRTTTASTKASVTVDPELIGIKPPNPRRLETNQFRRRKLIDINNSNLTMDQTDKTKKTVRIETNVVPITEPTSPVRISASNTSYTFRSNNRLPYVEPLVIENTKNSQEVNLVTKTALDISSTHAHATPYSQNVSQNNIMTTEKISLQTKVQFHNETLDTKKYLTYNFQSTVTPRLSSNSYGRSSFNVTTTSTENTQKKELEKEDLYKERNRAPQMNRSTTKDVPAKTTDNEQLKAMRNESTRRRYTLRPLFQSIAGNETLNLNNRLKLESTKIPDGMNTTTVTKTSTNTAVTSTFSESTTKSTTPATRIYLDDGATTVHRRSTISPSRLSDDKQLTKSPLTTTVSTPTTKKATQSIFDLYLNPTQRPRITYNFPVFKDSPFKLKIFSGGTTTPAPLFIRNA